MENGRLAVFGRPPALGLGRVGDPAAPIRAAFAEARGARRGSAGPSLVEQALGIPKGVRHIVDATCGLGRDAATLWSALQRRSGEVSLTLIEEHPILHALLESSLDCAFSKHDPQPRLLLGDATELLTTLSPRPEAVLLDPMFELHRSRALPKRDLQLVQELLGPGEPEAARSLLERACAVATRRVVVKRGLRDPALVEPVHSVHRGKSLRFDVYAGAGSAD